MSQRADRLAEVMFQAAVAVGHHACSNPLAAIREGVRRTMDVDSPEAAETFSDARKLYAMLYGYSWSHKYFDTEGPSWQMWLSKDGRAHTVSVLLFAYEYAVTELFGDRVTIPDYVTRCNTNQTAVHPTSDVV
jgi:hypothetical protein